MKIRMLTAMVGNDFSYVYGQEIQVSKKIGKAWIDAEIAEAVEESEENAESE